MGCDPGPNTKRGVRNARSPNGKLDGSQGGLTTCSRAVAPGPVYWAEECPRIVLSSSLVSGLRCLGCLVCRVGALLPN